MTESLLSRKKREIAAAKGKAPELRDADQVVSDEALFAQLGGKIKRVKS